MQTAAVISIQGIHKSILIHARLPGIFSHWIVIGYMTRKMQSCVWNHIYVHNPYI